MKNIIVHIISYLLLFGFKATAQNKQLITGDFIGYRFPKLVQEIELQTDYYFYYDSTETDSIEINLHADHLSLQQVLDAIFAGSDLHYTIRDDKYVMVSNHYSIQTALPKDFFIPEKEEPDTLTKTNTYPGGPVIKTGAKALAEKKLFEIGTKNGKTSGDKASLTGYVRDAETGEPVMGANISIDTLTISKSTDPFGYY